MQYPHLPTPEWPCISVAGIEFVFVFAPVKWFCCNVICFIHTRAHARARARTRRTDRSSPVKRNHQQHLETRVRSAAIWNRSPGETNLRTWSDKHAAISYSDWVRSVRCSDLFQIARPLISKLAEHNDKHTNTRPSRDRHDWQTSTWNQRCFLDHLLVFIVIHNGRRWQPIRKVYSASFKGFFWRPVIRVCLATSRDLLLVQ